MPMHKLKPREKAPSVSGELLSAFELQRKGRLDEAEQLFEQILKVEPANWQALHQLGALRLGRGRHVEALKFIGAAMKANPASAEAASNYGFVLHELNRDEEAIEYFNRALMIRPGHVPALITRGTSLHRLNRHQEALANFDRVLEIDKKNFKAHYNRANVLHELRRFDESLASFAKALALAPDDPDAHFNESLTRLLIGDFREDWKKYEWRWQKKQQHMQRGFTQPLWLGDAPVAGKTILIHAEQGFGDTLQFVRYVPLLVQMGAKVVLEVQPTLTALLSSIEGVTVTTRGEPLPAFDLHCPILSLPLAFKSELATIPAHVPYIESPRDRMWNWQARFPQGKRLYVAIAWSGSPTHRHDHLRSIALAELAPLFSIGDIQWISIQRDLRPGDSEFLTGNSDIIHIGAELADFADTAAVIELFDLIISVDTSVVHLAGAMGRPAWMLLPYSPDFRWLLDREDSPWYPTLKLFRQPKIGDWQSVIGRVRKELGRYKPSSSEPGTAH